MILLQKVKDHGSQNNGKRTSKYVEKGIEKNHWELLILRVYETCPGHFFTLNP